MASGGSGHFLNNLLLFGRLLRRLGLNAHTGRMIDAVCVLEHIGVHRRRDVRSALRTLLVHRKEDIPVFDEAFSVFWRQRKQRLSSMDLRSMGEQRRYRHIDAAPPTHGGIENNGDGPIGEPDRIDLTRTFSTREVLRAKDFADFTPEEGRRARKMMATLQWNPGMRRTRRKKTGKGSELDLRKSLHHNVKCGGELLQLMNRQRKEKPRRLVVICDISGSMESYTRMLLHFIYTIYRGLDNQVEAFLFATRLTRVTKQLAHRDIDHAVDGVAKSVPDWSGGTRIGSALKEFNYKWARRTLNWGAVVLVVSDGWDRGEPELLSREMNRLQRSCRRLMWLNPLAGQEGYEALTLGMKAAEPYIDDLLPVHNLAALVDFAEHLNGLSTSLPIRKQAVPMAIANGEISEEEDSPQRSWHKDANPSFRHPMWGKGKQ